MDVSDIAMLEAIVRHGSINKASEALHVTQPTLSKRLARLEDTLGTQLFLRSSVGLTPTSQTRFIIERAQPIKTMLGNIERHIELENTLEAGEVRLGVGPIIEQLYFPHVLHRLTESASSRLQVQIRTESADDLVALLRNGVIDIAVGPFARTFDDSAFAIRPIARQPLVYAVRPEHPLAVAANAGETLSGAALTGFPLIAPNAPTYIAAQSPVLAQRTGPGIVCDNYTVIKRFVRDSDHITAGPISVFSREVAEGTLVTLPFMVPVEWHAACLVRPESATVPMVTSVIALFEMHTLPT